MRLAAALRDAGLDNDAATLIVEKEFVAETIASFANAFCSNFRRGISSGLTERITGWSARREKSEAISADRVSEAVAKVRGRNEKVSQSAVATELGYKLR